MDPNKELSGIRDVLDESAKIHATLRHSEMLLGKRFNLFTLIRAGHEEVPVHSRFVGELLNSNGSHDMGNVFQKLFLELAFPDAIFDWLDDEHYHISIEKSFGNGRMDIVLENSKKCIVVENKIYAGDQGEQLNRYIEYAQGTKKEFCIFYLTLWGTEPSDYSLDKSDKQKIEKVRCISYSDLIVKWLKKCLEQVVAKPYLRENIQQYLDLVRNLTGTTEESMQEQIKSFIKDHVNKDSLKQLGAVVNALDSLRSDKVKEFMELLLKHCKQMDNLDNSTCERVIHNSGDFSMSTAHKNWRESSYIIINISDFFKLYIFTYVEHSCSCVCFVIKTAKENFPLLSEYASMNGKIQKWSEIGFTPLLDPVQGLDWFNNYDYLKQDQFNKYVESGKKCIDELISICLELNSQMTAKKI